MASDRKLVVSVIGDDRSFQETLTRSTAAAQTFARNVSATMGRQSGVSVGAQFDPLLERNRQLRAQADELSNRLKQMDTGFVGAGRSANAFGGSMLGLVGRVAAVGFAVNAAYSASRHLQQALETTGREATTTSGKFRNMAASLLSGDVVGAFEAFRRAPQNLEELGISTVEASNRMGALAIVARTNADELRKQAGESEEGAARWKAYTQAVDEAGTGNRRLAQELVDQVAAIQAADNAANALADSTARLGTVFRDATGQAVLFKGAVDDLGGPRGPGAVDQINAQIEQNLAGRFRQAANPDNRVNANKQIIARANGDLGELLRLQEKERDRLRAAVQSGIGNAKERKALQDAYVRAQADVIQTQKAIKAQGDATKEAAATAARQAKEDSWAKIIGALDIGVTRAQLTKTLNDDLAALKDLKNGLERQIKAGVDVASAQSRLAQTEVAIAAKQDEIASNRAAAREKARKAAAAALQASQFRALGLTAEGEQVTPGVQNLRRQLSQLSSRLVDEGEMTPKIRSQLARVRRVLSGEFGKVTEQTRQTVRDMFRDIRRVFDQESNQGFLTRTTSLNKDKVLAGLGLDADTERTLRARLGGFNSAGVSLARSSGAVGAFGMPFTASGQPINITTTVMLDQQKVGQSVTRYQGARSRSNPKQKRGPAAGI